MTGRVSKFPRTSFNIHEGYDSHFTQGSPFCLNQYEIDGIPIRALISIRIASHFGQSGPTKYKNKKKT